GADTVLALDFSRAAEHAERHLSRPSMGFGYSGFGYSGLNGGNPGSFGNSGRNFGHGGGLNGGNPGSFGNMGGRGFDGGFGMNMGWGSSLSIDDSLSASSKYTIARLPTQANPRRMALTPDNKTLVVSNHLADSLTVIDADKVRVVRHIKLGDAKPDLVRRGEILFHSAK